MLPASIVLVSQQQPRMKEMLSLKKTRLSENSCRSAVPSASFTSLLQRPKVIICGPATQSQSTWRDLKKIQRSNTFSLSSPSALLECSLRALAYTLSITTHLKKAQSMHLYAHTVTLSFLFLCLFSHFPFLSIHSDHRLPGTEPKPSTWHPLRSRLWKSKNIQ